MIFKKSHKNTKKKEIKINLKQNKIYQKNINFKAKKDNYKKDFCMQTKIL